MYFRMPHNEEVNKIHRHCQINCGCLNTTLVNSCYCQRMVLLRLDIRNLGGYGEGV